MKKKTSQRLTVNPSNYSIITNDEEDTITIFEDEDIEEIDYKSKKFFNDTKPIIIEPFLKQKDYSKVYTPDNIADYLVELLELEPHHSVLEPSAGHGSLIRAVHRKYLRVIVDYFEINELARMFTFSHNHHTVCRGDDFMEYNTPKYDRIIANPPFDEDKWLLHTKKMYESLAKDGIMVCIIPRQSIIGNTVSYNRFMEKMKQLKVEFFKVDNWATNKDGSITNIGIIRLKK